MNRQKQNSEEKKASCHLWGTEAGSGAAYCRARVVPAQTRPEGDTSSAFFKIFFMRISESCGNGVCLFPSLFFLDAPQAFGDF